MGKIKHDESLRELTNRFMQLVSVESKSNCWIWLGMKNRAGYGRFTVSKNHSRLGESHRVYKKRSGRRTMTAHRVSYELFVRKIPTGLDLDHRCRVKGCVNPAHLEPVTNEENIRRGIVSRGPRKYCKSGRHPWTKKTIYSPPDGRLTCLLCIKERTANRAEAEKAAAKPRIKKIKPPKGISNKYKTYCPSGHLYDDQNTYLAANGGRICRTCVRQKNKARQALCGQR